MSRYADSERTMRLDPDSFAGGYFKNAVYRHWDPYEDIPGELLEQDRERILDSDWTDEEFRGFRSSIAKFGAGEEAVTEDLAPLAIALDDINDQMFVSSQIYEEAKHAVFFDRYWREVIDPVAEARGIEVLPPTADEFFNEAYEQLFDKTEAAMHKLLEDGENTARNRVIAYCHYHLAVESVLAQTAYYGYQAQYSDTGPEFEQFEEEDREQTMLDGLIEGITRIRSDEGRHVGFGMHKVEQHVENGDVDEALIQETLQELLPHIAGVVDDDQYDTDFDSTPLVEYASEKLSKRIEIITSRDAELPPVEELVHIEGADRVGAD
jgi:ribonucleoside-diphosphate reductase beta chain